MEKRNSRKNINDRRNSLAERYLHSKRGRLLGILTVASIAVSIILEFIELYFMDGMSEACNLVIQGCIGLFAIISVISAAFLIYGINKASWQ